jgi:hypothetical protein
MEETTTTIRVMSTDINIVFRVTTQILGTPGPNGDFHRKLQLRKVHPSDLSPSVLVEKLVINSQRKPRMMREVGMIKTR